MYIAPIYIYNIIAGRTLIGQTTVKVPTQYLIDKVSVFYFVHLFNQEDPTLIQLSLSNQGENQYLGITSINFCLVNRFSPTPVEGFSDSFSQ